MGAPPVPRPPYFDGERATRDLPDAVSTAFLQHATRQGRAIHGYHNQNFVLRLTESMAERVGRAPGTAVTVRIRRREALPVVIRTWAKESEILGALGAVLPNTPECLFEGDGFALHSYVEGEPLSATCGPGKVVDPLRIQQLAGLLARMAQVRRESLPRLPDGWPRNDKDSQGFLRTLVRLTDEQIRRPNWSDFGGLFAALGIPDDALDRLADQVPAMARRPYSLLHTDLHRDNLIVTHGGTPPLICVDWELATYGDPLHDLATHLVRMRYPAHQWGDVVDAWADAMRAVRPTAVNGLAKDLRHYVDFERAQSVYPDVMRAAKSLEEKFDQGRLREATASVRAALESAARPLRLRTVPDDAEIERVLYRWQDSRRHTASGGRPVVGTGWTPAKGVPERGEFPFWAVSDALVAEGAAPGGLVFKGTAHLNSVVRVRVEDHDRLVVVRRMAARLCRREQSFLDEHKVLRAIEQAPVEVAAPRILALGTSYQGEQFAIHTYEGPRDTGRLPDHPVHGLRPNEADGLVDQLCALTEVDYRPIAPAIGEGRFYAWLSEQLAELVGDLPHESKRAARLLGLPDADRLHEMLSRHQVTERQPALLHGDLNPWNLVRRGDTHALTLIDWEMAMVGDPLYDLVRHMHLTPTQPEIRKRMFRRWSSALGAVYTKGWQDDWHVYRSLEIIRSAYIDLDRLVTGVNLDAPNVRRAVDSYDVTLAVATGCLGLPASRMATPHLTRALG
ncbi:MULTISPECIES: aminoglycoside phosphotransferase family protein [unclassified Streptomyces]|uniref:phosphotransferase family protein n=1 Tax=unclassified Streptomyces TaxID=2593676 RepID=UPI002E28049C|nr:aminoglycoside phosphotransferase family protein [Streptomyces sp. NBC_00228]